jgi:hypothetical protein
VNGTLRDLPSFPTWLFIVPLFFMALYAVDELRKNTAAAHPDPHVALTCRLMLTTRVADKAVAEASSRSNGLFPARATLREAVSSEKLKKSYGSCRMTEVQAAALATEEDRRKSSRTDVDGTAFIFSAGSSTRCRLVNLSEDGAAIDVADASYLPNSFQLMIESNRSVHNCRIAWIKQNRIGAEFIKSSETQPLVTHCERQFLQYLRDGE